MAMSVNRRSERNLPIVMGRRDPEAMIRVRSTDPIRASGLVPRQQAGHMTASDLTSQNAKKTLASWGPSTHDEWGRVRDAARARAGTLGDGRKPGRKSLTRAIVFFIRSR